jgi:serine/threonine-protein kinase
MTSLSDAAVRHLQRTLDRPDAGARYEVREEVGRGGMGVVYLAHDHDLGRDVALKALAFEGDSAHLADRLSREARVLARLEHPGIVAVHDVGVLADGRPFYVMRLVRGTNLAQHAATLGRGEVLRLFVQVCDAIAFAHARGVIHRDLTPRNVMVGEYGEVLVVDWGVARLLESFEGAPPPAEADPAHAPADRTHDGIVIGTPGYMPPEQAAGGARDADQRADVFGLGAILREILKSAQASTNARASDPGPTAAHLPRPLAAIFARATAPSPADRYPSASALAADVRRWLDDDTVEAYRESVFERAARLYARNRPLIWLLVTYAVVRATILISRGV